MNNKVLLMILDGWGNGRHDKADVISTVHPEYISAMTAKYPHAELRTDGENVGLPTARWAIRRSGTSISAPAAWSTRIW